MKVHARLRPGSFVWSIEVVPANPVGLAIPSRCKIRPGYLVFTLLMPSPLSPPASRHPKGGYSRWLVLSIVANLLLASYLVLSSTSRRTTPTPASTSGPGEGPTSSAQDRPALVPKTPSSTNSPPLPWTQIQTTNLTQYAANLRQVGCPDETVCDILRPAVDRWFTACIERLDRTGDFWAVGAVRQQQRKARTSARAALREEEDRFLATLPCTRDAEFDFLETFILDTALGFPPSPKREQIQALFQEISRRCLYWRERTGNIFLPEDVEAIHRERNAAATRLSGLLTARQLEEFELRFYAIINWLSNAPNEISPLHLNASECREFCRAIGAHTSDRAAPNLGYETLLDELTTSTAAQFQLDMMNILGPERLFAWLMAKEPLASQVGKVINQYGIEPTGAKDLLEGLVGWKLKVEIGKEAWPSHPDDVESFLDSEAHALRAQVDSTLGPLPPEARSSLMKEWTQRFAEEAWSKP